ncbi:MAG: phosphatidate cytidylyltransferase [Alphaproteobacteria bacterium]|nr:MAG: phosphatidate cytidylyltransferase [Alphaproteobacteria bacterium]
MTDPYQSPSKSPKKKNGLLQRVVSALVMLPIAIAIILMGGAAYYGLVILLTILILYEWNGICEGKAFNAVFVLQTIFVLLLVYSLIRAEYFDLYIYLVPVGLLIVAGIYYKMKLKFGLLGIAYALLPALSLIWIRENHDGWIVLWMMIIVWSMDTGAYFVGKSIGGPKMSPKISPNKTWAGLIGGAVTAVVFGLIAAHYFDLGFRMMFLIPAAAGLAIWSQIGDLAESALKRHFDVKDSGAIIPGHGGIMDRVDGVVFAAPAVALFLYL